MSSLPMAFIIEDQPKLSMFYEDTLRLIGFDVKIIRTGLEAINVIEVSEPPILIILDINLPMVSGHEVYKHIRNNQRYKNTGIIITTANTVMATKVKPEMVAGDHILIKPVGVIALQELAKEVRKNVTALQTQNANPEPTRNGNQNPPDPKQSG